jgi:hypothetical protein
VVANRALALSALSQSSSFYVPLATAGLGARELAPLVVSEAWRTERSEIAVFEAFSTETGWATLLRVQGEERVVSGRVVQVGAWAIVVQSDGATACVVDAWEPAAHRIALTPLHL